MASKINYNTKAPFQTREDIPDENKVNAEDMNEIKTAVNNNADELDTAKEDIESLQNGQGTASTDITSLKNRTTALETDNTTNKQNIQNLQTDNETNKTNITDLQNDKVDKVEGKGLSTEDFTTELKEKLEGLKNYDDTEIKEDISNLEAGQTEQDKQIDMLINALPTETQEAENINIKGTIPVKFKEFKLSGNSKQETRSGKNLLPYPYNSIQNFVIQDLGDGRIILNGTQETNTSITIKTFNLKAGTYKFLFNTAALPNNSYFFIRNQSTSEILKTNIKTNTTFSLEEDILTRLDLVLVAGSYSDYKLDLMILEATEEDESFEPYGAMPSPEYPSEIKNVEGDVNVAVANKEKEEQQSITFPLAEGQKLMKGDYLADNGIHHKRKQIELDGTENWLTYPAANQFYITLNDSKAKNNEISIMSNYYKGIPFANRNLNSDKECAISEAGTLAVFTKDYTNVSDFKAYLAQKKEDGTPVIVEYELAEEEIEAYTPEQQEAYNQLCNLKAYEEETNVYSENEISPIFKVTAIKDFNSVITQLNKALLERS